MSSTPSSHWADLDGPVHWVDYSEPRDGDAADGDAQPVDTQNPTAGEDDAVPMVLVHGLGGSHVNWTSLAPLLTPHRRVVALDLPGFGLTRGEGRATTVQANAGVLHRFIEEVLGGPALVVGNSMGALVSLIMAAEHPETVTGLALLDLPAPPPLGTLPDPLITAMFAAYALPGLGNAAVRGRRKVRTAEQLANDTVRLCCFEPARVSREVVAEHVALTGRRQYYPGLETEFTDAARSVVLTISRRRRYLATAAAVQAPVLLVHGDRDRLVPVRAARALAGRRPEWRYREAADVGHVPMLEVPEWTATQLEAWLTDLAGSAKERQEHIGA